MYTPRTLDTSLNGTSANDFMVGGSHYHQGDKSFQHWDLVAICQLGYYEGQITRYISRAKKKNGIQDYEKAHHYAVKMRELFNTRVGGILGFFLGRLYKPMHGEGVEVHRAVNSFCVDQKLDGLERSAMLMACLWRDNIDLDFLVDKTEKLKSRLFPEESKEEQIAREVFKARYRVHFDESRPDNIDRLAARGGWYLPGEEPSAGYVCQDPDIESKAHPLPHPTGQVQVHPDSQQ